jgi:hypothetical protein
MARDQSKHIRVPITVRALVQRLGRMLAQDGKALKKTRTERARSQVGNYYVISNTGGIVSHHIELEALGRETGALADHERLVEGRP